MKTPDQALPSEEIPPELDGRIIGDYMDGHLGDIENISRWVSLEGLKNKKHRVFSGFEIYDDIDGALQDGREVSFVLAQEGSYPQHVHKTSDAFFVVIDGAAVFVSGESRFNASTGTRIKIPKGTPHGFDIKAGDVFKFVSIQTPPIKDHATGEEDFHLVDLV